jgi:pimeloyl-ACP methyl ester carboxylesterase
MPETSIRGHVVPDGRMIAGSWVRQAGEGRRGRAIVLLHGLGATAGLNWFGCFEPLQRRHVIAPDLIGHGRTPCSGRSRLADAADRVANVLDELGAGHAVVAGYSMGGAVAQLLAHRRPDLVDGLVLAATARDFRGRPADRLRFTAASVLAVGTRAVPALPLSMLASVVDGRAGERWWAASEISRSSPAAVCSAAEALGRFTSRRWVGDLDVPSTVLLTTRDRLVPPSRQVKLAHGLSRSRLVPIEGDHLVAGKAPDRFAAALVDAVADVERRTGAIGRRRVMTAVA